MSEFTIAFELNNMVGGPAGEAVAYVIYRSQDGVLDCYGTTVPTDDAEGFATGCTFRKTDGGAGTSLYVNEGDFDDCDFNAVAGA